MRPFWKHSFTANLKSWCHSVHYFRQNFDVSNLTLHDNTCLWWGLAVGCLDVTFIAVGWKNLLATGMDDCGGHCHTQSQVRPLGCVYMLCVCARVFVCVLLSGLAVRHNEEVKGVIWARCMQGLHHRQVKVIVWKIKAHNLLKAVFVDVWTKTRVTKMLSLKVESTKIASRLLPRSLFVTYGLLIYVVPLFLSFFLF